jgi:flagellar biosynthesis/type III secretory pathway protein FliH
VVEAALEEAIIEEEVAQEPSISEEELEAIRKAAHDEGFRAGQAAAMQQLNQDQVEREKANTSAMQCLASQLKSLSDNYQSITNNVGKDINMITKLIANKLCGKAMKNDPTSVIQTLVDECLPILYEAPFIHVHVHSSMQTATEELMNRLASEQHFAGEITIKPSETLGIHDCKIEWPNGSATRNTEEIWKQVTNILNKRLQLTQDSVDPFAQLQNELQQPAASLDAPNQPGGSV